MRRVLVLALTLAACGDPAIDDMEPTPSSAPTVAPTPVPTPGPTAKPKPSPSATPRPLPPLVPPATCSIVPKVRSGNGQFVNNPANSRGTLKLIWPNRYTNKIVDVTVWGGTSYFEKFERKLPNEYNDRERYYGARKPSDYPAPLVAGALLTDGNRVCVTMPDPTVRLDWVFE